LTHANVAVVEAVAILLFAMTTAIGGQGAEPSVNIRPIEDFLEAQGTEANGIPAPLNSVAWADPKAELFIAVDYAGLVNQWIEEQSGGVISLGTEIEGKIIERPLPDGRAVVTVLLHTKNAFTVVSSLYDPLGPPLFGYHAWDVADGAEPALGESFLKWVFINDALGVPLPDLCVELVPGPTTHEFIMLSLEAQAEGALREAFGVPDGTPGHAQTTQVGLYQPAEKSPRYPAEHIKVKVVGR
jgi:hypothetical protein